MRTYSQLNEGYRKPNVERDRLADRAESAPEEGERAAAVWTAAAGTSDKSAG